MNIDQKFDGSHGNLTKNIDPSSSSQRSSPLFNSTFNLSNTGINSLTKKFSRNLNRSGDSTSMVTNMNQINDATSPNDSLNNFSSITGLSILASGEKITSKFRSRLSKGREKNQSESSCNNQQLQHQLSNPMIVQKNSTDWRTMSVIEDFQVDEEGYRINPEQSNFIHDSSRVNSKGSDDSSTSSDENVEANSTINRKKLNVVIKPLMDSNISTNVQDGAFKIDLPYTPEPSATITRPSKPTIGANKNSSNLFALPPPQKVLDSPHLQRNRSLTSENSLLHDKNSIHDSNPTNNVSRERPRPSSVLSAKLSMAIPLEVPNRLEETSLNYSSNTLNESFADFDKFGEETSHPLRNNKTAMEKDPEPKGIQRKDTFSSSCLENEDTLVNLGDVSVHEFTENDSIALPTNRSEHDQNIVNYFDSKNLSQADDSSSDRTLDQEGDSIFVSADRDKRDDSLDEFEEIDDISSGSKCEGLDQEKIPSDPQEVLKTTTEFQTNQEDEVYVDPEMTEDDMIRRLVAFGQEKQKIASTSSTQMRQNSDSISKIDQTSSLTSLEISILIVEEWLAEFPDVDFNSLQEGPNTHLESQQQTIGKIIAAISKVQALSWLDKVKECQLDSLPEPVFSLSNASKIKEIRSLHIGISIDRISDDLVNVKIDRITFYAWLKRSQTLNSFQHFIHLELIQWLVNINMIRPPVLLCTNWRFDKNKTDFRLDYSTFVNYNNQEPPLNQNEDKNLSIAFQFAKGLIGNMRTQPECKFCPETQHVEWQVPLRPPSLLNGVYTGTISGTFETIEEIGCPEKVYLKFILEGSLPSGVKCSLLNQINNPTTSLLKMPLIRERLIAEKYAFIKT